MVIETIYKWLLPIEPIGQTQYLYGDYGSLGVVRWSIALTAGEIKALDRGISPLLIRRDKLVLYFPLYGIAEG